MTESRVFYRFGYGNRVDRCGEQGYILVSCAHSNTSFLLFDF